MGARRLVVLAVCSISLSFVATLASAQSTTQSGIDGRIVDETGSALPGVTVTLRSPALQLPEVTAVTDGQGRYRFTNLPAGAYVASYDLSGFQSIRREGLQIGVGAVMTLNLVMRISTFEESVTVSGASPVIDIRSTTVTTNLTTETMDALPTSRTINEIVKLTPGARLTGRPDVAGDRTGDTPQFTSYGSSAGGFSLMLDGLETGNVFRYYDVGSVGELQVRSLGKDPEFHIGGTQLYAVLKSGGNDFHGGGMFQWQSDRFQSDNVDDNLRSRGVTTGGDGMALYYDSDVSLGGPILRDRVWFFGGGHWQGRRNYLTGYIKDPGPDGAYFTADDLQGKYPIDIVNYAGKVTSQLTRSQRLEGFYNYNNKLTYEQGASAFRPFLSTSDYRLPSHTYKAEWSYVASDQSLFNVLVGNTVWYLSYGTYTDEPTSFDNVTLRWSGAAFIANDHAPPSGAPNGNAQVRVGYSYFFGSHDFKVGGDLQLKYQDRNSDLRDVGTGGKGNDFAQYFNNGVPFEIYLFNTPNHAYTRLDDQGLYARDNWRVSDRLTLNLGVRWHRAHSYFPAQTRTPGPFCDAQEFAQRPDAVDFCTRTEFSKDEVFDWRTWQPRLGMSYALTSDNKTVMKVSYGRYGFNREGRTNNRFNKNAFGGLRFRWTDLNGNGRYDHPAEAGAFVRTEGAVGSSENPDLVSPVTEDFGAHLERELLPGFMGRVGYVYKRESRLFQEVSTRRPHDAYTVRIDTIDPGPDGRLGTADDNGPVTYYDFAPAFRGAAFEQRQNVNVPGYTDQYHNFEVVGEKRFSDRWQVLGYFLATRRNVWIAGVPQTPNELHPKDETWEKQFTLSGSYNMPFDIQLSSVLEHRSGDGYARDVRFTTGLQQLSAVIMRMEPIGAQRHPAANLLSVRVEKRVALPKGQRLRLHLDFYNMFNSNAVVSSSARSGATYGRVTGILPPRIARFGARFEF